MSLLLLSFLAGMLTVTAPCIVTLLPVVIGGTVVRTGRATRGAGWQRPVVIAASLAVSVVLFTVILKASTTLLGVPQMVWQVISGGIVLAFGVNLLFPQLWEQLAYRTGFGRAVTGRLQASAQRGGLWGDLALGAALGPVFTSCSPTYALIVAAILPVAFLSGLTHIIAYAAGLALAVLVLGMAGRTLIGRLGWLRNPRGWFFRLMGVVFVVVGVGIIFGLDKQFEAFLLDAGLYDAAGSLEERLRTN